MDKTQKEAVLNYLREHKNGITSMTAFSRYGITRLSAIIFKLRKDGYRISTTIEMDKKNRYGNHTQYARYTLEG